MTIETELPAVKVKPVICIGHHTISQLMAGQDVEIEAAIMIPASDLCQTTPAESRCEELVKALEPFAKAGQVIDGPFGPALFAEDDMAFQSGCAWTENGERKTITWGDFRRARSALSSFRKRTT